MRRLVATFNRYAKRPGSSGSTALGESSLHAELSSSSIPPPSSHTPIEPGLPPPSLRTLTEPGLLLPSSHTLIEPGLPPPSSVPNRARTPQHKPTRLDMMEDSPPFSDKPTLEEEVSVSQEVARRRRCASQSSNLSWHPIEKLMLPEKIVHPGAERYIGSELLGEPKYLFDSHTMKTVLAKKHMFAEGYVAVSYTWGRWRVADSWQQFTGTPWKVPSIQKHNPEYADMECNFNLKDLTGILRHMPNQRYFWIDVLCINQSPQNAEQKAEKGQEIAKQGAIFKNARGVLVYLWSIDQGAQLAAAVDELDKVRRHYWQVSAPEESQAERAAIKGSKACSDKFARVLRSDPWFTSLWTLQEMILAPASVWIARDGSHCQMNGQVLTTHTVADIFYDFIWRERCRDVVASGSLNPSRSWIGSLLPASETEFGMTLQGWLRWAFQETSITTCVGDSRSSMLRATLGRKYTGRRELAVLAALKVGNDQGYDKESKLVSGLAVGLWNKLLQAEGGRLFDCSHSVQPGGLGHAGSSPLTDMFPTTAASVNEFGGIRYECTGWNVEENGELRIPKGSPTCLFSERKDKTEYRFCDGKVVGGHPTNTVNNHLSLWNLEAKHVRFVTIGYHSPYHLIEDGRSECTAVTCVILVTMAEDIRAEACRWYKVGTVSSRDFSRGHLEHDITVGFTGEL